MIKFAFPQTFTRRKKLLLPVAAFSLLSLVFIVYSITQNRVPFTTTPTLPAIPPLAHSSPHSCHLPHLFRKSQSDALS